jgi:Fe-S-cluster containining protein
MAAPILASTASGANGITGNEDDESEAPALASTNSHPAQPSWYAVGLPFECTECGKCCKTQGSVFMHPAEIRQAANMLKMQKDEFIERYASRTLQSSDDEECWIRLINTNQGACVFLDPETNHCGIYKVRPVQCWTYPFWPDLMKSPESWNQEVRTPDDAPENKDIPYWTPHGGGCEGMARIGNEKYSQGGKIVSPFQAHAQLLEYEETERLFPNENAIIRRVKRK